MTPSIGSVCFPFGGTCVFGQIQLNVDFVDFKKDAQCECGELSLIGGKMRAAARDAALQAALRNHSEEARGGARLHKVLQRRAGSLNVGILLLVKENQTSQVKEFSAFLCLGRGKSLGSLKPFPLMPLSHLGPASCFHILRLLRAHRREWLQADGC